MCYPVQCPTCGKTGWAGCGQHVEAVTRNVPTSERCVCQQRSAASKTIGSTAISPHFKTN